MTEGIIRPLVILKLTLHWSFMGELSPKTHSKFIKQR